MNDSSLQIRNDWAAVQDHSRQYLDFALVYPVISRRSRGLSIGINLNPDKVCNFDCIYCEVDRRIPGKISHLDLDRMRAELVAMIRFAKGGGLGREPKFREVAELTRDIRDLAFSGDGEPTLIPNFSECVRIVAEVRRQEELDQAKIVLITDAAGLDKADVQRGLEIMDANNGEVWGKLDAGTEPYYRQVNRTTIRFDRILKNLLQTAQARPIVIQSLFLKVHGEAMPEAELAAYCDRLTGIVRGGGRIKEVHAYTVARPTPETFATKLDGAAIERMADFIRQRTGLAVHAFA